MGWNGGCSPHWEGYLQGAEEGSRHWVAEDRRTAESHLSFSGKEQGGVVEGRVGSCKAGQPWRLPRQFTHWPLMVKREPLRLSGTLGLRDQLGPGGSGGVVRVDSVGPSPCGLTEGRELGAFLSS